MQAAENGTSKADFQWSVVLKDFVQSLKTAFGGNQKGFDDPQSGFEPPRIVPVMADDKGKMVLLGIALEARAEGGKRQMMFFPNVADRGLYRFTRAADVRFSVNTKRHVHRSRGELTTIRSIADQKFKVLQSWKLCIEEANRAECLCRRQHSPEIAAYRSVENTCQEIAAEIGKLNALATLIFPLPIVGRETDTAEFVTIHFVQLLELDFELRGIPFVIGIDPSEVFATGVFENCIAGVRPAKVRRMLEQSDRGFVLRQFLQNCTGFGVTAVIDDENFSGTAPSLIEYGPDGHENFRSGIANGKSDGEDGVREGL